MFCFCEEVVFVVAEIRFAGIFVILFILAFCFYILLLWCVCLCMWLWLISWRLGLRLMVWLGMRVALILLSVMLLVWVTSV